MERTHPSGSSGRGPNNRVPVSGYSYNGLVYGSEGGSKDGLIRRRSFSEAEADAIYISDVFPGEGI